MADLTVRVHRRRRTSAVLLASLVASTSLWVVAAPRAAGADQLSALQAQAAAISQQLIQQQLEVDTYQQRYSVASARVAADGQAIDQIGQQIGQDTRQIAAEVALVRSEAVRSYMDYGTGSGSTAASLFAGNQEHAQAASEYSSIAVGHITTAVDLLHTAQDQLQSHQTSLRQQQDRDRADQSGQAAALGKADASAGHLAALHGQVTGQLATAVADQAAVQNAAAVAAVAAAQKQAARSGPARPPGTASTATVPTIPVPSAPGTTTTPVTPPPGAGANLPDPALNPFLLCVIQRESGGNYAINTGNGYYGAFQFSQSTWNIAAQDAGLPYLVGVVPSAASKAEQDTVAVALFALDGGRPWTGDCGA